MDFEKWDHYDGNDDIDKIDEEISVYMHYLKNQEDERERKLYEDEHKLLSSIKDIHSTLQSNSEYYEYEANEPQLEYK